MRELDAVLVSFLRDSYSSLGNEDKARFSALLELPDPDLHAYLVGRNEPADAALERLLSQIRADYHS
jgi:antitoxin CptB